MQRQTRRAIGLAVRVFMACFLLLAFFANAGAQVHVRGYTKKNGTHVAPHYRSSPNSSKTDNYSRGNYNPFNGERGTTNPYPVATYAMPARAHAPVYQAPASAVGLQTSASPLSWSQYQPAPMHVSNAYVLPAAQAVAVTSVFRCEDAYGTRHYLSYPRAGCVEIQVRHQQLAAPQVRQVYAYSGYGCTSDCSGHEAGYEWAEEQEIEDPDDCGGNSNSFIEGCQEYAEERQEENEEEEAEDQDY